MTSKVQYMMNYIRCNYALEYRDIFYILKEDFLCCFQNYDFFANCFFLKLTSAIFWILTFGSLFEDYIIFAKRTPLNPTYVSNNDECVCI